MSANSVLRVSSLVWDPDRDGFYTGVCIFTARCDIPSISFSPNSRFLKNGLAAYLRLIECQNLFSDRAPAGAEKEPAD